MVFICGLDIQKLLFRHSVFPNLVWSSMFVLTVPSLHSLSFFLLNQGSLGDVVVQPYNSVLTLKRLSLHADSVVSVYHYLLNKS